MLVGDSESDEIPSSISDALFNPACQSQQQNDEQSRPMTFILEVRKFKLLSIIG